jgi:hypothetical protein
MLESFSRPTKSYIWLGGVNAKAAGISTTSADKLTQEEILELHEDINYSEMDNIELAEQRLRAFKFAKSESERAENRAKLRHSRKKLK